MSNTIYSARRPSPPTRITGRGILELVREKGILSEAQITAVLDPRVMTGQAHTV